jgi:biopolymer transport protein ExbB
LIALIEAAGWPIWFILVASVIALAIIGERWWSLREGIVMPRDLLAQTLQEYRQNDVSPQMLSRLAKGSPLGRVFAAGLRNAKSPPEIIKDAIEESGRTVAVELERFLTSLGTIAAISPLLGLFGTVVGMIEIFGSQTPQGGNPLVLAHGISIALYNTAFGLVVAVPAMIFYRHFRAKVDVMLVDMEMQAIRLVEIIHGERM